MKKILMLLAFLGIASMIVGSQDAPMKIQVNVAELVEWRGDSMTEIINYLNDSLVAQESIDYDTLVIMIESLFHLQPSIQNKIRSMAVVFSQSVNLALKDSNAQQSRKKLDELKSYLTSKGKFIAKMYELYPKNYPWITTEVALRGTTFGSEYRKEYFLADEKSQKRDNEKQDNLEYFFYSEPTQKPGIGRILGLGYVDKRTWKKYLFEKAKYPALIGALGYGAYKGAQTERGQQLIKSVQESEPYKYVADSQAGKWVGDTYGTAQEYVSDVVREGKQLTTDMYSGVQTSLSNYFTKRDVRKIENIEKKQNEIREKLEDLGAQVGKGIWTDKKIVLLQRQFAKLEQDKKSIFNKSVKLQEMKGYEDELKEIRTRDEQRDLYRQEQERQEQQRQEQLLQDNRMMSADIDKDIKEIQREQKQNILREELSRKQEEQIKQEQKNLAEVENERSRKTQQDQEALLNLKEKLAREKQARLNQQREQQRQVVVPDPEILNVQLNINQEEIDLQEKERLAKQEEQRLEQEGKRIKEEQKLLRKEERRIRDNKQLAQGIDEDVERMHENETQRQQYQQEREQQQKMERLESQARRNKALIMPIQREIERENYLERINRRNKLSSERVKRLRRISGESQF